MDKMQHDRLSSLSPEDILQWTIIACETQLDKLLPVCEAAFVNAAISPHSSSSALLLSSMSALNLSDLPIGCMLPLLCSISDYLRRAQPSSSLCRDLGNDSAPREVHVKVIALRRLALACMSSTGPGQAAAGKHFVPSHYFACIMACIITANRCTAQMRMASMACLA